ncbi:MAG: tol-pal system protein YbgF, partial [Aestuariivirgaceae bacterium]|nr:tol-pal system protein YbgF [Aestuariivirgaceae bacterium]
MIQLFRAVPIALFLLMGAIHPVMAQDSALRLSQMEDQMRQLVGQIENLNIELRQTKEQLARMQADAEFRLQQLEGGAPGTTAGAQAPAGVPAPA